MNSNAVNISIDNTPVSALSIDKLDTKHKDEIEPNQNCHIIPKHPARVLINGASGSGKTNMIINLLTKLHFYKGYFNAIYLFSASYFMDDVWENLRLPEGMVNDGFSESILSKRLKLQEEMVAKYGVDKSPKVLFLFDDCIDDQTYYRSKSLKTLFTRGRHLNSSTWFSTQEYVAVPPKLRKQMSDIIVFEPTNNMELERIASENAYKMRIKDFERLIMEVTKKPYNFMVMRKGKNIKPNERYLMNFDGYIKIQPD
jgi:hypothetical protein